MLGNFDRAYSLANSFGVGLPSGRTFQIMEDEGKQNDVLE